MPTTIHQLLGSPNLNRVVAYFKTPTQRIQEFFGALPGGPLVNPVGGHYYQWDIFNRTRQMAGMRAVGAGPGTSANQVIGNVGSSLARFYEKTHILDEKVFRTRPPGGRYGTVDARGEKYVNLQLKHLTQKFRNSREFIVSRMLRGGYAFKQVGDDWRLVDLLLTTGLAPTGSILVDLKVPTNNKNFGNGAGAFAAGLDMKVIGNDGSEGSSITGGNIISATWSNVATDIPLQLGLLNDAFEVQHGRPLKHIWTTFKVWNSVLQNTAVRNLAGTASSPFAEFSRMDGRSDEGIPDTGFTGRIKGLDDILWHMYGQVLEVDGSTTRIIPEDFAFFMPTPSDDWCEFAEGSEPVAEHDRDEGHEAYGFDLHKERFTQPPQWELIGVDNGLMIPYVPACIAFSRVM